MGSVTQMPGTRPAPPAKLGTCEWCRAEEALRRVEIAPAKREPTPTRPLRPGEGPVVIAACASCADRLETKLAKRRRELEEQAERAKQARKAARA